MPGRLSVCMIVKDEADVLPRCLASLAGVADEIIAVDTGSSDDSRALLQAAGATVIDEPWQDDFSKARNKALEHATGDWVLFIDADEAIDPATRQNLRLLLVDLDQPVSFEVPIQSYLTDAEDPNQVSVSWMPRLFNKPSSHVYIGRIHENLYGSMPVRLDLSTFGLLHWGYQPARKESKKKLERNDLLLTKEREQDGDSLRTHFYAAMTAKSPAEVIEHAEKALAKTDPVWTGPTAIAMAAAMILDANLSQQKWDAVIERATALRQSHPVLTGEATFLALEAQAYQGRGDDATALTLLQEAFEAVSERRSMQSYWTEMVPANIAMRLAKALNAQGDRDAARQVLETALTLPRLGPSALANLRADLAGILISQGEMAKAAEHAQLAIADKPSLRASVANHYLANHHSLEAIQAMAAILDPMALRDRIFTLSASLVGDPQGIQVLQWYLANHEDTQLQIQLGLHLLALGESELAQEAVAKGLGIPAGDIRVALHLALFEQNLGRLEAAEQRLIAMVQAAVETENTDWAAEALVQWGNLAYQTQQWAKAADVFREALTMRPQDPYLHYALGSVAAALGDTAESRSHFERALIIDPNYAPAHQGLDALAVAAGQPE